MEHKLLLTLPRPVFCTFLLAPLNSAALNYLLPGTSNSFIPLCLSYVIAFTLHALSFYSQIWSLSHLLRSYSLSLRLAIDCLGSPK